MVAIPAIAINPWSFVDEHGSSPTAIVREIDGDFLLLELAGGVVRGKPVGANHSLMPTNEHQAQASPLFGVETCIAGKRDALLAETRRVCRVASGVRHLSAVRVHPRPSDRRDGPVAVNALRCDDAVDGGSRWRSVSPVFDIALVKSPSFVEVPHDSLPVRALATAVSGQAAAHLVRMVGSAMEACTSWWGPTRGSLDAVTVVLSPREGWAYSRLPLILLPGGTGTTPEAMHTVLHETGHLWWRIARPLSADDWLNEGLAEYAANRLAQDLLPPDFTQARLTATLAEIAAHSDDEPVLESTHESPAGHRNRYLRPAVALDVIERRVGAAALDRVLGAWLDAATDRPLATSAALAMLEHHVGLDVAAYLRDALTTTGWHPRGDAG